MIKAILDMDALPSTLTADTLREVKHLKQFLNKPEPLPIIHPDTQEECVALIASPSSDVLEAIAGIIKDRFVRMYQVNSNPCRCWYFHLQQEARKGDILQDEALSRSERTKKVDSVESEIRNTWTKEFPVRFAASFDESVCPYCGKHRELTWSVVFMDAALIRHLIQALVGAAFPLRALPLYAEWVSRLLYSEEMIPDAKKKPVAAILQKWQPMAMLDMLYNKVVGKSETQTVSSEALPTTLPDSTPTMANDGDSARPMWTPDSPLPNETSTTSNTLNSNEKP